MAKLSVFNFMTLNGYFKGINDDTSWHQHGNEEEGEFAAEGAQSESIILFGRKTYDMMAGFWPTPEALKIMPAVADGMNRSEKIVFSRTLKEAHWQNTKIINSGMVEEVKRLKASAKKDMVILGSGSVLTQLAEAGLMDSYQFLLDPIALGTGTTLFNGLNCTLNLRLTSSRTFKSGAVLLSYDSVNK
ncbi:MAG TPA: dihydrofolate reductase family protein [Chryseolinea sp.]